jgi:hypothetical protein
MHFHSTPLELRRKTTSPPKTSPHVEGIRLRVDRFFYRQGSESEREAGAQAALVLSKY